MQKKLCFLLACCLLLATSVFCVNAQELEADGGYAFAKGELLVRMTEVVDLNNYTGEGPFDFYGVSVTELSVVAPSSTTKLDYEIYLIKLSPEYKTLETAEVLMQNAAIISASPNHVFRLDGENWGGESVYDQSPFVDMSEEELKAHWGFIPDEVALCLDYELDLAEFEGEGEHYLFGVSVAEISRIESAEGFVYSVKFGEQFMENEYAVLVFNSNEHVLWTEYETMYGNGDINEDGDINSLDYLFAKRICFGTYTPTNCEYGYADLNVDGKVDSIDYLLLKRSSFGTYTSSDRVITTAG